MRHVLIAVAGAGLVAAGWALGPRGRGDVLPAPRAAGPAAAPAADAVREHHEASLRRHRALKERMDAEPDEGRRAELGRELRRLDAELEIEGLEIKRRQAEAAGDSVRAAEIQRLMDDKRNTKN